MQDLKQAEAEAPIPSVALGRLGPPELSKLLFEAQLLKEVFGGLRNVVEDKHGKRRKADAVAKALADHLDGSAVRNVAPSIGIPIMLADGKTVLRGPRINVPELSGHKTSVEASPQLVDAWARKGWIDLRADNANVWLKRIDNMIDARMELRDMGSAAATIHSYLPTEFEIGEVVAWIFNNEMGGYRIK
jgi:hypothetical protein